ncbi:tRNA threonylcarbamoyladenosine modification (KEOPS) complex Pcc1 subunit [Desulfitispora alkaliphila]|uniref:hypothetical protein n=1 Tax=Desulfitispora alkaliphila TaxID=622674 RepID=UPI003D20D00B
MKKVLVLVGIIMGLLFGSAHAAETEINVFSIYAMGEGVAREVGECIKEDGDSMMYSQPFNYSNDKGIFVHIIGDGLTDDQAEIIWGQKVEELEQKATENGVSYNLGSLNENVALLISAKNIQELRDALQNDYRLKEMIREFKQAEEVEPEKELLIPRVEYSLYALGDGVAREFHSLIRGIGHSTMFSYPFSYNNDKGIFIHIIGDNLTDAQAEIIWGHTVEELERITNEKGVIFDLGTINENAALRISAKSLDYLKNAVNNDKELQKEIKLFLQAKKVEPKQEINISRIELSIYSQSRNATMEMSKLIRDWELALA